ncbi:MAG TPA: stage V sporulation protein AC [Firmicutes bacterium]|jgi:stage V sporulation protein AC|nr:stage V sporulation protein AC [Bacillota bacterium]
MVAIRRYLFLLVREVLKVGKLTREQEVYKRWANARKPKPPLVRNTIAAFLVGGLICTIGQIILNFFLSLGMNLKEAGGPTAAVMIFLGALLTGLGVYDRIGKFAGAGSVVPITGFANSIVAPALEFKREGYVMGVGARMFNIAGPVLVYGMATAWLVGLFYWLVHK